MNRSFALPVALVLMTSAFAFGQNPAVVPVQQGGTEARHNEKIALVAKEKFDLLLIGDSITQGLESQPVWQQFFAPRHALNLGYSGGRTENILWNLSNGELTNQSPKVAVLMIGTNNSNEQYHPNTSPQVAAGIAAIVQLLREKLPATKILLLRGFPYGERPGFNFHDFTLNRACELAMKLADNQHVFYCDVNHVFFNLDGTLNRELMPDLLHPSAAGAKLWAQAMEPLLSQLMGDPSRDTEKPSNTAIIPVPKLEQDSYDWYARHADVLRIKDALDPDVVLIGDSITHFWGGEPKAGIANGPKAWQSAFGKYPTLNLGFGWDRIQNVLWRVDHGELDGLHPRVVILNIGTNNTSETPNARRNTPAEIAEGIRAILIRIRSKAPAAKIVLMGVFPRGEKPDDPVRAQIAATNRLIAEFGKTSGITFLDIGPKLLQPDGTISRQIMSDFCHPTEQGYQIWADALSALDELANINPTPTAGRWVKAADVRIMNGPAFLDDRRESIGFCNGGGSFMFGPYRLATGTISRLEVIVGVQASGGKMHVRLDSADGPTIGTFEFQYTGGWHVFKSQSIPVNDPGGDHLLYFVFEGGAGICNFKQFRFLAKQAAEVQPNTSDVPLKPAQFVANLAAGKKQVIVAMGTSLTDGNPWVQQLQAALDKKYQCQGRPRDHFADIEKRYRVG